MINLPQNVAWSSLIGAVIVVLFVLISYFPILDGPFKVVYDSDHIVDNALLSDPNNIIKILSGNMFRVDAPYRPITLLSQMAERHFFKSIPLYYYLVNILLHAACALLAYAVITLACRDKIVGLLTALIFAIHPAHWEAVSFLSGRAVLLNTFFTLISLSTCMLYMRRLNGWWMFISLTGFICALLSHEAYGATSAVFIFYLLFMARDEQPKGLRWLVFLPYAVVSVMFVLIRHGVGGFHFTFSTDLMDWAVRLMGALRSLFLEACLLVAPQIHFYQSVNSLQGLSDPAAVAAVVLTVTGFVLVIIRRKKLNGVILFLAVWFISSSWPLMNNAFDLGDGPGRLPMHGTMSYMACVPFIALIVLSARKLLAAMPKRSLYGMILFGMVAAAFFVLTFRQNILSTDEIAVLKNALQHEPASAIIEYDLGITYAQHDSYPESQKHFERAVQLDPNFTSARMGLGKVLYEQGKFLDAAKAYEAINNPGRYESVLRNNLRGIYNFIVVNQEAILRSDPKNINAYFSLGVFYEKLGDPNRAIAAYQQVLELDTDNASGLKGIALRFQGLLYQKLGLTDKARENFAQIH